MNELGNGATTTAEGLGIRANPNFPSHIHGAGAASRKSKIFKIFPFLEMILFTTSPGMLFYFCRYGENRPQGTRSVKPTNSYSGLH